MADVSLEMILELQRRALEELRALRTDLQENTRRLGRIEHASASEHMERVEDRTRLDRLAERVERIERRLELREE